MANIINPGKLSKDPEGYRVKFERVLPFDIGVVWDAITNPAKLGLWFMDTEMEFQVGGKMIIRFPAPDDSESFGKITRIVDRKVFEYYWEEELVTWELEELSAGKCKLRLTHSKVDGQWAKSVPAGWHFMFDLLEDVLAGREPGANNSPDKQERLKADYAVLYKDI